MCLSLRCKCAGSLIDRTMRTLQSGPKRTQANKHKFAGKPSLDEYSCRCLLATAASHLVLRLTVCWLGCQSTSSLHAIARKPGQIASVDAVASETFMDPLFSACRWKQWPCRLGEGWLGLHHGAYLVAMLGRPGWQRLQRGLHLVAGSKQTDMWWHMT